MPTARLECTFVIKEGGADRPFIVVEPTVGGVDIAFPISRDMTIEDAHALVRLMRRGIDSVLVSAPGARRRRSRRA